MRPSFVLTFLMVFGIAGMAPAEEAEKKSDASIIPAPTLIVADGLNTDGSLVENYRRGLDYAIDYFGNYGPYYVYLLSSDSEESVRQIYLQRAKTGSIEIQKISNAKEQVDEFLKRHNVINEIKAVLAGKAEGGLTWTQNPPILYEDVTTNAKGREKDPLENTWELCTNITMFSRWHIATPSKVAALTSTLIHGWQKAWHLIVQPSLWRTSVL